MEVALSGLQISRGTLVSTLAKTFNVPQTSGRGSDVGHNGLNALIARIRQLGALGVPSKPRPTMNAHLTYGLTEVAEISMAMALMNAHMSPALAARYVKEKWSDLATLALAGMLKAIPGSMRDSYEMPTGGSLALIEGNILRTLGNREARDGVDEVPLAPVELFNDAMRLGIRLAECPSAIVLNAGDFMYKNLISLRAFAPPDDELRLMLDAIQNAATGED
ncbi:hypothetical protein [Sphingomonas sp. 3P27F8]|uniref:hypothetical protein n=1 Tax=unclassified Sphingomonas TaxID=196159 RepID=UPI0010F757AE|nr:hypothetical protein [Sphingomonas sp. 3P27F8]